MMVIAFKCSCGHREVCRFYRKYIIEDGKKTYLSHPSDFFYDNAIEENPYIHKETHVIKWFEKGKTIPEEYEVHSGQIPYCPICNKEMKMDDFIGCA